MKSLLLLLSVASVSGLILVSPVVAETERFKNAKLVRAEEEKMSSQFGTAGNLLAQGVTRVTDVEVIQTEAGLELVLKTVAGSEQLIPVISPVGNDLVIDILDATLDFSIRRGIEELNPAPEISRITVGKVDETSIRVVITGENDAPRAEVVPGRDNLVLNVTSKGTVAESESIEEIEVIATREIEDGYVVDNATIGTRTDTPIKDIPQSIQIVPQEVIKDRNATNVNEALETVSGAGTGIDSPRDLFTNITLRGFLVNTLTNGLADPTNSNVNVFNNIDRVEVLRGPSSVLFGQGTIGGTVNYRTKQPLTEPFYALEVEAGRFDLYSGAVDLSGPLNEDQTVLYRLSGFAKTTESFVDFFDRQEYQIAPVLTWNISDRTSITFEADYSQINTPFDAGLPVEGTVEPNPNGDIPRDRSIAEPDIDDSENKVFRIGYDFTHRLSDNWQLRSTFRASLLDLDREIVFNLGLAEDLRNVNRLFDEQKFEDNVYNIDNYVVGEFSTGSIEHKLVAGFNLYRQDTRIKDAFGPIAPLDVFNPVYGSEPIGDTFLGFDVDSQVQSVALFVQDQINFTDNLILLLGGRFDIANQDFENAANDTDDFTQDEVFSPRVGIVYQPSEVITLYTSFTRSFQQTANVFSPAPSKPREGTQYEIGVKADISDRFFTTLALYDLTLTNVPTADPTNPFFTVPSGEQSSRGVELDINGEILPGWNIILGYAYTDARVTEDNTFDEGNQLSNIPKNQFNIWTTYTIQQGSLEGLGFGLGLIVVDERPGDIENSFELPGYTRTDAAIFYERNKFRAAVNIKNLFDEDYFVSSQSRNSVFPGDPLIVTGSLSYKF
ncbi:MAG: TonB-dependent siderophore receptor [Cyanobacteria bacterium P01_F01_bin.143]